MSLLAWYPLIKNGKNQGLDGIDLTTVGTVTYTAGKLGNAATFTNNSGIRFRRANFTEQTGWSVSAWVKCSATTSAVQYCFNNGRDANNDGWMVWFSAAGTTLYLRIGNITWSMTSTLGTWYHVCMTIDVDSKYVFYVNGTQVATGTVSTLPDYSESGNLMAIGGFVYNGGNIYPLNGQVQDFRYYNNVLSKKEVKELSKGLCLHVLLDWGGNPNLQPNSNTFGTTAGNPNNFTHETKVYDGHNAIRMTCKTDNYSGGPYRAGFAKGTLAIVGTKYTWSMYIRGSSSFTMNTVGHECGGTKQVSVTTEWKKVTHTWTVTDGSYTAWVFYGRTWALGDWIEVKDFKVEEGSVATPYIPNVSETLFTSKGYSTKYTQDCSGYNHTATITGTAMSCSTNAPRGTGTNWNGSGKIAYADGMPVATNPLFTINFWIRTKADTTQTRYADVCLMTTQNNAGTTQSTRMELENTSGSNLLWHGINAQNLITSNAVTPGTWYMQTFVSDGSKVIAYRNATQIGTYDYTGSSFTGWKTTGNIQLGDTTAVYYDLADFRVYATVLSLNDIKELYNIAAQIDKYGKVYCNNLVEM